MNKKIAAIILLVTVISITSAIVFSPKEDIFIQKQDKTATQEEPVMSEDAYEVFKKYIVSTPELKNDTEYYIKQVRQDLRNTFDILNNETDTLLTAIFTDQKINIDEKINIIKKEDKNINNKIDEALKNFKTQEYLSAFNTLKKYIGLQNNLIYKIVDIYKKEKSFSYDRYTGMLHTTHGDMTSEEENDINFITSVDMYADREY